MRDVFRFDHAIDATEAVKCVPRASETVVRRLKAFTRTTGLTRSRRAGYGVGLYSTREYRTEDDIRRLAWKYLASKRRLVVKEMELETMNRVIFCSGWDFRDFSRSLRTHALRVPQQGSFIHSEVPIKAW